MFVCKNIVHNNTSYSKGIKVSSFLFRWNHCIFSSKLLPLDGYFPSLRYIISAADGLSVITMGEPI